MNSRRETIVLAAILIAAFVLGLAIGSVLLGGAQANRAKGDPNDVSAMVAREMLIDPDSLRRGPSQAPFTLVEFGDYQCASCGRAEPKVRELLAKRRDVSVVFRNYPLQTEHHNADVAARAAEVAHSMGKGWEMHDALYDMQAGWAMSEDPRGTLVTIAGSIGLDRSRFRAALEGSSTGPILLRLQTDRSAANACSVQTTPSFFLVTPKRIWAAVGPVGLDRLLSGVKYWQ